MAANGPKTIKTGVRAPAFAYDPWMTVDICNQSTVYMYALGICRGLTQVYQQYLGFFTASSFNRDLESAIRW
jgi:hypothetical protein